MFEGLRTARSDTAIRDIYLFQTHKPSSCLHERGFDLAFCPVFDYNQFIGPKNMCIPVETFHALREAQMLLCPTSYYNVKGETL